MGKNIDNTYFMDYINVFWGVFETEPGKPIPTTSALVSLNHKVPVTFYSLSEEAKNMPFVIHSGGFYTVGDKYFTKRKNLNNYELLITYEGKGYIETENECFECSKGSAVILNCMDYHYMYTSPGETWSYRHLHFTCKDDMRFFVEKAIGFVNQTLGIEQNVDLIANELTTSGINSYIKISKYMTDILTEMAISVSSSKISPKNQKRMASIGHYIQEHLAEPLRISELAEKEFMSIYHFTRQFNLYFGVSPTDYIIQNRLNLAKSLLLKGYSVSETATLSGFINSNNLYRQFKKNFGVSPSKFART